MDSPNADTATRKARPKTMKDKRRFFRWSGRMPCECQAENMKSTGYIIDLSFGGARIVSSDNVPPEGADVTVAPFPDQEEVLLLGQVVYSLKKGSDEGGEFGVEFYERVEVRSSKLVPLYRKYLSSTEND